MKYSHKALILKNLDNSGDRAIESEALQLNKNAYGIRLYLNREETIARAKQINTIFIQSAYAFTRAECPPEFIYTANDKIISIKVFTLNKFDNQHSENTDITNYFKVAQTYSDVKDYIASIYYSNEKVEYQWPEPPEMELKIDLMLMTAPTMDNKHQFKIQVTLSDGRILEQQTTEIQLL